MLKAQDITWPQQPTPYPQSLPHRHHSPPSHYPLRFHITGARCTVFSMRLRLHNITRFSRGFRRPFRLLRTTKKEAQDASAIPLALVQVLCPCFSPSSPTLCFFDLCSSFLVLLDVRNQTVPFLCEDLTEAEAFLVDVAVSIFGLSLLSSATAEYVAGLTLLTMHTLCIFPM